MNYLELLSKLIAFDTTSRNSNRALIDFIAAYLAKYGISSHLSLSSCQTKANLVATLPAGDGSLVGGLVLSGHTDVVPVDGQNWSYPPFALTALDGKVYGRGTCDMKGFIAVVLSLIPELVGQKLAKPLHLAFSYDEEVGCCGAVGLLEDIKLRELKPEFCLVGEPTSLAVVTAHKGINVYRVRLLGKASHSSLTNLGCNAIDYAAELIVAIRQMANQLRARGEQDADYDVPYSTMSTNLINGGIGTNIVPEQCEFYFELRNLPHLSPQQILQPIHEFIKTALLPRMQAEFSAAAIEITPIAQVPGLQACENQEFAELVKQVVDCYSINKVAYATEAGLFQACNIPTIVCGPGSIEQAHRPDEFVSLAQLELCSQLLEAVIQKVLN
jgi:acetylornithine deacetylase